MPYTPNPEAAQRRAQLAAQLDAALAAMYLGCSPTTAGLAAVRDAYRSSCRALRTSAQDGARKAITQTMHARRKARIEAARAAWRKAQTGALPQPAPFTI